MLDWHFLTFFGDSMLLLPCSLILFAVLVASRATRTAGWQWALIFGCAGGVVCISKLAFMGWGIGIKSYDFTGFSGHSALAASIWPVLLWALTGRFSHAVRSMALVVGLVLPVTIGLSRLAIHVHSPSEVVSGLILGYLASTLFLWLQRGKPRPQLSTPQIVVALALPMVLMGVRQPAPTQGLLEHIATVLAKIERPYTRADLHKQAIVP
ncbi:MULTISPECIES: phosphatase PAP2 family protein [Serratia]|uniref:Phosphatase PAP2 family protein n=1 Tax=Serratia grimesii TaxID=82995 RepID=A0A9C7QYV1_9GAMM|nr:phosphatase PAP2 family protein [Serratia grimesii]CAI0767099.1 PAP2 superfamily [Serratia grimesii]CAI2455250.1 PAP2 superfamily [Serratia grimesii]SUI32311.1 PAP2 superfamily [Serratia grimesii]HCK02663.1 phosphatase PAP2 family protein [Serratia grimesii]